MVEQEHLPFPILQCVGENEGTGRRTIIVIAATVVLAPLAGLLLTWPSAWLLDWLLKIGLTESALVLELRSLMIYGPMMAGGAAATLGIASRVQRRAPLSFITAARRFRWRHLLSGLALNGLVWAVGLLLVDLVGPSPTGWTAAPLWAWATYVALVLTFTPVFALAEEVVFRGWLLQQAFAVHRRVTFAVGVSLSLFVLAHADLDAFRATQLIISGAGLAWATLRMGGVEFAAGLHIAWNLASSAYAPRLFGQGASWASVGPSEAQWWVLLALATSPLFLTEIFARTLRPRSTRHAAAGQSPEHSFAPRPPENG